MFKPAVVICLFLVCAAKIYGQDSVLIKISEYKKERGDILTKKSIYTDADKYADLLTKKHLSGFIEPGAYRIADSLDKFHPKFYFSKANELVKQHKLNEAGFIYYLGCLRYIYYNAVNPYYKAADDGILFLALKTTGGEPINMYLHTSFENFTEVLKKSSDWFLQHDYAYCSKSTDTMEFLIVSRSLSDLVADMEKNKQKYTNEWKVQRLVNEQNFDKELKEIDGELRNSARE